MSWQTIKKLKEDRGEIVTEMRGLLKKAEDETRDLTADEDGKFNEMNTRAEELKTKIDREEKLYALESDGGSPEGEKRAATPGRGNVKPADGTLNGEQDDEKRSNAAFTSYLRGSVTAEQRDLLVPGTGGNGESRAALSSASMGVVGPNHFHDQIIDEMRNWTGVRQAGAFILESDDGREVVIPTGDDTGQEAVIRDENEEETRKVPPTLGNVKLGAYTYSTNIILVPRELLQDAGFDIEGYLRKKIAEQIGVKLNKDTTTGTGNDEPRGFAVAGGVGATAAATNAISYENLLDLVHSVPAPYRQNRSKIGFQFSDVTLAGIRKLKGGDGAYLWAPGRAGEPDQVLGYPYTVNDAMADAGDGAGSIVAAFGDWSYYWLRDVGQIEVLRLEERYAEFRQVGFYGYSRHDGDLTSSSAVKVLKTAAA